jgi:hypothetical protein
MQQVNHLLRVAAAELAARQRSQAFGILPAAPFARSRAAMSVRRPGGDSRTPPVGSSPATVYELAAAPVDVDDRPVDRA